MGKKVKNFGLYLLVSLCALNIGMIRTRLQVGGEVVSQEERTQESGCIGLNYHRVRPGGFAYRFIEMMTGTKELTTYTIYKEEFERQLQLLKDGGAYFATLEELMEFRKTGKFPEKCVWISFDDVDKSVYDHAFPILKEKGIPFTLFVIAGQVGNPDFKNLEMATWEDLREMRDSGLASFGSHTYNMHYLEDDRAVFLDKEMYEEFEEDIKKSKKKLETQLDVPITSIAYPFGDATEEVSDIVQASGYTDAFTLYQAPITMEADTYRQSRYLVHRDNFDEIYSNLMIR